MEKIRYARNIGKKIAKKINKAENLYKTPIANIYNRGFNENIGAVRISKRIIE
jgi:hypothetical protein